MTTNGHDNVAITGAATSSSDAKKLIRGSSLLTFGRVIAIILNFVVQVITVRYLMKADYGAFAYGLSIASMGASFAVFGLGRTLNRFAPLFQEKHEFGKMAGTIVLTLFCVTGIGLGIVVLVLGTQGFIGAKLVSDPLSLSLMLILVLLAPLRALDSIFEEMFATFAKPRDLFVRRHLIGPLLKMLAIVPLIFAHSDVRLLAVSFVVCGAIGTLYSVVVLWKVLKKADLLQYFRRDKIDIPARQIFGFSFPLLSTDLLVIVRSSLVTLMLEFCHGALGVAAFRAVLPVARLNSFVADSVRLLFSPAISRMFARGETDSIDRVFWRTSAWIAVATFPLFLTCVCLPEFITVTLFGTEYADSASILSLLATGFYLSAVVGLNNEVLKAHGHVGRIFLTDILTVIAAIALNLWLVPRWGILGGAATTVVVLLMRPIGNQITIFRMKLLKEIDWKCLRLFFVMLQIAIAAWLVPGIVKDTVAVRMLATIVGTAVVLIAGVPVLDIGNTFPELMKYKPIRLLLKAEGA